MRFPARYLVPPKEDLVSNFQLQFVSVEGASSKAAPAMEALRSKVHGALLSVC